MSLTELFPNSNNNIVKLTRFLENFDIIHKLPMNNMNESISKNEKSLSPGETQVIILASQIWKTFELRIPLLLLDEPERNIDFDTIKKIFTFLESFYDGTVVLITHSENLTKFVERNIKQVWNYSSEHFCNATECSQRTLTFSISDRL
jgi:ATPase subunit of ABC transporter with duplicated ATPase domains